MDDEKISLDLETPGPSESESFASGKKATFKFKWSGNVAEGTIVLLRSMEKAAGAIPIPGFASLFFLTAEIVKAVDDTKENKRAFGLLAEEASALAFTLMDEWKEIKEDEKSASRYQSLERHVAGFVEILEKINDFAEDQRNRTGLKRFGTSKKDGGLIQEYHGKLKAAVDRFNVQSHIATGSSLNRIEQSYVANSQSLDRIEALLRNMKVTTRELESVETRPASSRSDTRTDDSSDPGPQVVLPELGSRDRASTMGSTSSNIPSQNIDVVTPTPQVPLESQGLCSASSEAQLRNDDRGFESQSSQGTPSLVSDRQSIYSTPSSMNPWNVPTPTSRPESSPASFRSTNPFMRLATIPDSLPTPPGPMYTPNLFSPPTSDTPNPFSSMLKQASGVSVTGNVTVNHVSGSQSTTTNNVTNHNVNTGNTYNTSNVNSNNRYAHSSDPWLFSSGPTYNFQPNVWSPPHSQDPWSPPPNHFQHSQNPSWSPPPDQFQHPQHPSSSWPTPPNYFHPPWPPSWNDRGRGRGNPYYRNP